MTRNDWYEAGEQIKNLVQEAVDTGDFSQLGNTISAVVNDAVDGVQDALRGNLGGGGRRGTNQTYSSGSGYEQTYRDGSGYGQTEGSAYSNSSGDAYDGADGGQDQTYRGSADRARRAYEQAGGQNSSAYGQANASGSGAYGQNSRAWGAAGGRTQSNARNYQPVPAGRKLPGEVGSKVMKYLGFGLSTIFGLSLALSTAASLAVGSLALLLGSSVTTGVCFVGSFLLGMGGQNRRGITRRFRRYQELIGTRTYCKIEELAAGIGENAKYVKKDLKKMIRRGYFAEGYLDRQETLLITDQATYQQYLQTEEEYERRRNEQSMNDAKTTVSGVGTGASGTGKTRSAAGGEGSKATDARNTAEAKSNGTAAGGNAKERTPEHQALIEEGQKYIRHIHECNERIPGEEITAKLNRLELVVTRIFREAEKNPDAVSDLRKMMSYYLPTTRKLLDAYCELDDQPVSGQNIDTTKREIEAALDTLNTAFENLLDSLYEEQAWDISSDISVLNTMLAQEGLTKQDFKMGGGNKKTGEKADSTEKE